MGSRRFCSSSCLASGIPALNLQGVPDSRLFWAWFALVVSYTAYVTEVLRAGFESVHPSQRAAASALGLGQLASLRYVVVPQAVRTVIPPLLNDFISLQKDTALVGLVGVVEVFKAAQIEMGKEFNFTALVVAAAFYVALTVPLSRYADWMSARQRRRSRASGGDRVTVEAPPSVSLRVDAVHKAFGDNAVLRGVELEVGNHEVVTLIGASGSGKSTLLRCIDLLEPIDAGAILLDGVDISWPGFDANEVRRKVGIVFQSYNLFPHLSVLANVTLAPRKVLKESKSDAEQRGRDLLQRFGLADKADDYPDRLSGGQQQRVAIVRALAMEPKIMLFDEITSALDPELVGEVLDVIRELKDAGLTMVLATHEMAFAREIATRVAFLDAGTVVELGPPEQVFDNPARERTRQFLARVRS